MKNFLLTIFLVFFPLICLSDNLRVIDGDSIVLNGKKIRFHGIDTPELKQFCLKGNKKIACGLEVKKILIKYIGNDIPECLNKGKDIYKRILAECFINGQSISKYLVRSGHAFAYRKYSSKFIKDEDFAKKNKLGLWALKFEYPWNFRKKLK